MAKIYSVKLTAEQNAACECLEKLTGYFPAVALKELEQGSITPTDYWQANLQWIVSVANDAQRIKFPQ